MPLPRPTRRTPAKIGLFLLAGAGVNVGVALALDLLATPHSTARYMIHPPASPRGIPPAELRGELPYWAVHRLAGVGIRGEEASSLLVVRTGGWRQIDGSRISLRKSVGLPFQALWSHVYSLDDPTTGVTHTTLRGLPLMSNANGYPTMLLPTGVHPMGFAANTAMYATLFGALHWADPRRRDARRRARGLCPRCKYDIRGLDACPECGAPIRRKAAAS